MGLVAPVVHARQHFERYVLGRRLAGQIHQPKVVRADRLDERAPEAAPPHVEHRRRWPSSSGRAAVVALAQPRGEGQQHAKRKMIPVLVRVAVLRARVEMQRVAGAPLLAGERRTVLVRRKNQMGRWKRRRP